MFFAAKINSFFCQPVSETATVNVALIRIDGEEKREWPSDDGRPQPVLGINQSREKQDRGKLVREFESESACIAAGFGILGPSHLFAIYLDWNHYEFERPIEFLD